MDNGSDSKQLKHDKRVLVTGGCGYIGSHTVVELLSNGYKVVIVDNLSNSQLTAVEGIKQTIKDIKKTEEGKHITCNEDGDDLIVCAPVDLCSLDDTEKVFQNHGPFVCCIHFAALKAVGDSVKAPVDYYENNIISTLNLIKLLKKYGCRNLVFSSSGAVYGEAGNAAIKEEVNGKPMSPYGNTKLMAEIILKDVSISEPNKWNIFCLRYFNPIGAHPSGHIGENPKGTPNNLLPIVCQVATKKRDKLSVFGDTWDTRDGTCIRDYLHVCDLAEAHVLAVSKTLDHVSNPFGWDAINLGTGNGTTVLEIIHSFMESTGVNIPYVIAPKRDGDVQSIYADASKAVTSLGWKAKRNIVQGCKDAWNYVKRYENIQ